MMHIWCGLFDAFGGWARKGRVGVSEAESCFDVGKLQYGASNVLAVALCVVSAVLSSVFGAKWVLESALHLCSMRFRNNREAFDSVLISCSAGRMLNTIRCERHV